MVGKCKLRQTTQCDSVVELTTTFLLFHALSHHLQVKFKHTTAHGIVHSTLGRTKDGRTFFPGKRNDKEKLINL